MQAVLVSTLGVSQTEAYWRDSGNQMGKNMEDEMGTGIFTSLLQRFKHARFPAPLLFLLSPLPLLECYSFSAVFADPAAAATISIIRSGTSSSCSRRSTSSSSSSSRRSRRSSKAGARRAGLLFLLPLLLLLLLSSLPGVDL